MLPEHLFFHLADEGVAKVEFIYCYFSKIYPKTSYFCEDFIHFQRRI